MLNFIILLKAHAPNLPSPLLVLLSPGISHSRHSSMQKGVREGETQEREEPVLESWRHLEHAVSSRTSDGQKVGAELRGAFICVGEV